MTRPVLLVAFATLTLFIAPHLGEPLSGARGDFVFWQLRVPRVLVGALVGSVLSLAGAAYQALFRNHLATPSTVGTTAGATLGALVVLVFRADPGVGGMPGITLAAFVGAALTSALVSMIAAHGRTRINDVLLAGIAVTLAASAFSTAAQYLADSRALFAAAQWSLGQLPQVGYEGIVSLVPFCAVSLAGLLVLWRPLQALSIDEDLAHAEGVNVRAVRVATLCLGSLGVAACVAWCGPIAFVGLIVPHLVRLSLGAHLRQLLPMSALFGAAFLVACDTLARLLIPGREVPVGVVTAALGAPTLLWLILRKQPA